MGDLQVRLSSHPTPDKQAVYVLVTMLPSMMVGDVIIMSDLLQVTPSFSLLIFF